MRPHGGCRSSSNPPVATLEAPLETPTVAAQAGLTTPRETENLVPVGRKFLRRGLYGPHDCTVILVLWQTLALALQVGAVLLSAAWA